MTPPTERRSERGFWHMVALQFQGAFSDNLFKQTLILGIIPVVFTAEAVQITWNGVIGLLFVLPFFLVSIWSGMLADKFSKRKMTLATKIAEVVIMAIGLGVLALGDPHLILYPALAVLLLMSTQSTFYSPNKYGIIPELVSERRLSWANGVIELTTFVAIIIGTGFANLLLALVHRLGMQYLWVIGAILVVLAVAGLIAGLGIDKTPAANPTRRFDWNFLPEFGRYCRLIRKSRTLFLTVLGLTYFWAIGSIVLGQINIWGMHSLGMGTVESGWLYIILSLGIGGGAMAAGWLSHGKIELGLVPLGGIGMAVFALPMAFASPPVAGDAASHVWLWFQYGCVLGLGVSAGFFSLPLNAILQHHTDIEDRGGIMGATNVFTAGGMVGASIFVIALGKVPGVTANTIFMIVAVATVIATFVLVKLLPEALLRFVAFLLTNTIYRIRPLGLEKIPEKGGVLLLCNHVSYIDALLLGTVSPRPVRFVAYAEFFNTPLLGFFLRATRSIPVSSEQRPRELIKSLKVASDALAAGEIVCLFPEGQLTRTGQLLPFHRGYELILREAPAPIVPVYLDGVWGSIFSYSERKFFWKRPRQIPYPVRVIFGDPLPHDAESWRVRRTIEELGAEAALAARPDRLVLHHHLVRNARRHWGRYAMTDMLTPKPLSWGRALTGAILFARRLEKEWAGQERVGILLPPSVAATLLNYAAALTGRAAINLNYTIGQEALEHCARQAGVQSVVTSNKFLEKVGLQSPARQIDIEAVRDLGGAGAKLTAMLVARLAPFRLLCRYCRTLRRVRIDDLATVIFSSGSTGMPKGIPLTHFNVVSNIESFRQAIALFPEDRLLGTLPFFHSFGYTVSLWGSAMLPFACVYHHNPLDSKTIGELAEKQRVTLIITTPTFLQMYTRRIPGSQFGGVHVVVAGAERLSDNVAEGFERQFGIEPLQGYGTTECSPVVAVNVPGHRSPGIRQVGSKPGTVGHPLPGIAVRVLDADTGEPLPPGEAGLLHVRGANVMSGYLDLPEKTAEVLRDGWYNTGDMAKVDEDGFITITGRLSRFSKIGGEMVPHVAVEDKLHEILELEDQKMAVTGVPDEKKGEQLVVIHTLDEGELETLLEKLPKAGLPNIFVPRREMFFHVEELPMLGTGKLDLKALNAKAREMAAATAQS